MGEDFYNHRRIFDGGPSTRLRTGDDLSKAASCSKAPAMNSKPNRSCCASIWGSDQIANHDSVLTRQEVSSILDSLEWSDSISAAHRRFT